VRHWKSALVAVLVLAVGCSDPAEQSSGTTTSTTAVVTSTTRATTTTTVAPTTVPAGCQDGPPPSVPYRAGDDSESFREGAFRGDCYHFWAEAEDIDGYTSDEGDLYACSGDFSYGTTPPMIDEVQSIYVQSWDTSACRWLLTAEPGDTVEVWTSPSVGLLGYWLRFDGISVHDAG
jgi:hypothetical protein